VKMKKILDRSTCPVLYKIACVRNDSMMTISKHTEQTMQWQPCAAMYAVVCSLGLTLSGTSMFGDRSRQPISVNRRNSRH
jgi:hypothetical protein